MQRTEVKQKLLQNETTKATRNIIRLQVFKPGSMEVARSGNFVVEQVPGGATQKGRGINV